MSVGKVVTVSSKGQFTVPRAMRDRLGVAPGDRVRLEVRGDALAITPATRGTAPGAAGNPRGGAVR